jgi:hypothetical protein
VVDGGCVYVIDFLVEIVLGEADLANALELLFKVLFGEDGAAAFNALVIHGIGLDGILVNDGGGPLAELHGHRHLNHELNHL